MKNSNPGIQAEQETTMKTTTFVRASMLIAALGFACLLPATARAQADTAPDPDLFQLSKAETMAAQMAPAASSKVAKADFMSKFSLPYGLECSGKNLVPGRYLLSIKSEGARRVVTIHGSDGSVNIQARLVHTSQGLGHSALLVRRSNQGRRLEGVYVEALNATLYLDRNSSRGVVERLPLS